LAKFFKLIRIGTHVGHFGIGNAQSMNNMEKLLPCFSNAARVKRHPSHAKPVVAADETFFGDFLILVLMGFVFGLFDL